MKRLSAALLVVVASATIGFAASTAAAVPRAQLQSFACLHALDPANRTVSVNAVMRPLPGTQKLMMEFSLLERSGGSATAQTVVGAGDLGVWISPKDPNLGQLPKDVWNLNKSVLNLDAPAAYRFRVAFRWIGAHGRVIGTAQRLSRTCDQRELRPDLVVKSIAVSPIAGKPHKDLYTAVIANDGATSTGPFEVLFTPGDDSPAKTRAVASLGAHQFGVERFVGAGWRPRRPPTVLAGSAAHVHD
jgi:hypothetical protein